MSLRPPGTALAWANRRLIAARTGWPPGALEVCEAIDRRYPGWHTSWTPGNTTPGFEHPAGYQSSCTPGYAMPGSWTYGPDPNAIAVAIARVSAVRAWQAEERERWLTFAASRLS